MRNIELEINKKCEKSYSGRIENKTCQTYL